MSTDIQKSNGGFSLAPRNLEEAMKYSEILAKSNMVPKNYQGRPGDILVAVQMGAEIGLKPLQALQNIATINGKPSVYGDAALAIVKAHPSCEDIIETFDKDKMEATCIAKRKGKSDVVQIFNKDKATKANLWAKQGPWTQYPERMLQMRARSYALRDQFPDVLQGLILAEEAQDYIDVTSTVSKTETVQAIIDEVTQPKDMPEQPKPITLKNTWTGQNIDIPATVLSVWLEGKLKQVNTKNELAVMEQFFADNKEPLNKWKRSKAHQVEATAFESGVAEKRLEILERQEELKEKYADEPELDTEMPGDSEYEDSKRC